MVANKIAEPWRKLSQMPWREEPLLSKKNNGTSSQSLLSHSQLTSGHLKISSSWKMFKRRKSKRELESMENLLIQISITKEQWCSKSLKRLLRSLLALPMLLKSKCSMILTGHGEKEASLYLQLLSQAAQSSQSQSTLKNRSEESNPLNFRFHLPSNLESLATLMPSIPSSWLSKPRKVNSLARRSLYKPKLLLEKHPLTMSTKSLEPWKDPGGSEHLPTQAHHLSYVWSSCHTEKLSICQGLEGLFLYLINLKHNIVSFIHLFHVTDS